ncbi:hypothetical protein LCGC14_2707070 [marine sediment metagenome]|uniref:Peptidoglycan recognition protein family domain-containing protein n=1 Tax=marine sediment metagenome TaxID=412755 RepID=A0A0F8ZE54_9ZZZZ
MAMTIAPGLVYLTRREWGADTSIPRLGLSVPRSERTEAIIHHTVIVDSDATKNLWTNLAEVKAKMSQLQVIRPDLGMDVPYNFVMFLMEDGTIVVCEGRGLDRRGSHTKYHNRTGIATALQGNFMLPTRGGLSTFIPTMSRWWGWLRYDMELVNLGSKHPVGRIAFGHVDFSATACPGDNLYAIIPQLTFKAAAESEPEPPEPIEEETVSKLVKSADKPETYITDGHSKRWVPGTIIGDMRQLWGPVKVVSQEYIDWLGEAGPVDSVTHNHGIPAGRTGEA